MAFSVIRAICVISVFNGCVSQIALSIPDVIIAAAAVTHQLTLVTLNAKDFPMSGLSLYPLDQP